MGSIYRRKRSTILWCKYYVAGRPVRESTGSTKEAEARRFMKLREGAAAAGQPILQRADRVAYDQAAADLRTYYATTGSRDLKDAEKRLAHLDRFFAGRRLITIGGALAQEYVRMRQTAKPTKNGATKAASNGTINRELAVLTKMLRLAYENGKLTRLPVIRKLKEAAPRAGFFERDQFEAVARRLPEPIALAARVAYTLGWRRAEVFGLERRHVDLGRGTLTLDVGTTKSGEGRVCYLTPDLLARLRAHLAEHDALQKKKLGRVIPRVFVYLGGVRAGQPIQSFRKRWEAACRAAGYPGRLFHDLRRSGVRNMVRAGVSEHTAMKVSGHKTRSIFDRYDIVSEGDLQEAARRIAASAAVPTAPGTIPGTVGRSGVKSDR